MSGTDDLSQQEMHPLEDEFSKPMEECFVDEPQASESSCLEFLQAVIFSDAGEDSVFLPEMVFSIAHVPSLALKRISLTGLNSSPRLPRAFFFILLRSSEGFLCTQNA